MKKLLFTLSAVALIFASCDKSSEGVNIADNGVVEFTSDLSTRIATTDSEAEWEYNDQIGIYMGNSSTTSISADNIPYVSSVSDGATSASTTFTSVVAANAIIYPNSGTVDFYAYYPYDATVSNSEIVLDVADQTVEGTMGKLDFMTASVTGYSRGDIVALEFAHNMAKLSFTISTNENVTSLSGLKVAVSGHKTEGSYSVKTGSLSGSLTSDTDVEMYVVVTSDGSSATAEAIIHPETTISSITFSVDGRSFGAMLSTENTTYTANKIYGYTISVGNDYASFEGECTIADWDEATTSNPVTEEIF